MNITTAQCIEWIKGWFSSNGGENAIIGISGGKDSTVVAKLCCEALGKEHVIGVLMPNGMQMDIKDSFRVCELLDIEPWSVDISYAYDDLLRRVEFAAADGSRLIATAQTRINLAPRLRMATLYAIAQSIDGGRVACTGNLDESLMGYFTLWGDSAGDFAPLAMLHVSQVIAMGLDLGLPEDLVRKTPSDGLTGKSDEEALGFSYADVENVYENGYDALHDDYRRKQAWKRMVNMAWKTKLARIPHYTPL